MSNPYTAETNSYEKCKLDSDQTEKPSMVDHPTYYNRKDAIECIDEMELVFGPETTAHFCLLNCWKYRYRAGLKNNGYEDLEKSDWYMRRYKELKEKIEEKTKNSLTYIYHDVNMVTCSNK